MNEVIRNRYQVVENAVAAGSADENTASVDLAEGESVTFICVFGAITAGGVQSISAQQSDDDGVADGWSDILGSDSGAVADDDDNKAAIIEVIKPQKRYVRCVVQRATQNSVIESVVAIISGARKTPVTQGSTVAVSKTVVSPAEGTP